MEHFPRVILPYLIGLVRAATSFRDAEIRMHPLVPLFDLLTNSEAQSLAEAATSNGQVWSANRCRKQYLPAFIRVHQDNIEVETLRALKYQVENDRWYPDELVKSPSNNL